MLSNKITMVVGVVVLIAAVAVGSTLAYYTSSVTSTNVVTMGNVEIRLNGGEEDLEQRVVMPGNVIDLQDPLYVENTGANPAYVRIKAEKYWQNDGASQADDADYIGVQYQLGSGWVEGDGYFYYQQILQPGSQTSPLYDSIILDPAIDNNYIGLTGVANAHAEAIQSDHFEPERDNASNIVSWGNVQIGAE